MKPATSLPWVVDEDHPTWLNDPRYTPVWIEGAFESAGSGIAKQDVAYIVHACNAYPRLVAALKALKGCVYFGDDGSCESDKQAALRAAALLKELGEST